MAKGLCDETRLITAARLLVIKSLFPKIIIFTSFHPEASNSMFSKLTFKFQYWFMQHIFSTTTLVDTRSGVFESSRRDLSKTGLKIIMF